MKVPCLLPPLNIEFGAARSELKAGNDTLLLSSIKGDDAGISAEALQVSCPPLGSTVRQLTPELLYLKALYPCSLKPYTLVPFHSRKEMPLGISAEALQVCRPPRQPRPTKT